jgi:hypothetical protein
VERDSVDHGIDQDIEHSRAGGRREPVLVATCVQRLEHRTRILQRAIVEDALKVLDHRLAEAEAIVGPRGARNAADLTLERAGARAADAIRGWSAWRAKAHGGD